MSQLLDWQVFVSSMVQLKIAVTVLPARLMLALDVINAEPTVIAQFLKAMVELERDLLGLVLEKL